MNCTLCPHNCNIDRTENVGACLCKANAGLSRVAPHYWEEPCISGDKGSGAIFFAGCNLKCVFCQNYDISVVPKGIEVDNDTLAKVIEYVGSSGVANINLVSPSQFSNVIAKALAKVKHKLSVPVIYNTNSYEKVEALRQLDGLVDVYLPDLKFCDSTLSREMCGSANYFEVATKAIEEMLRQQPINTFNSDGYIERGVIVRHLVLPSHTEDSKLVLDYLASLNKDITVSLMAQYFPTQNFTRHKELNRKLFQHEYDNVRDYFFNVGLHNGFMQDVSSATEDYVPEFDLQQVQEVLNKLK